VPAGVVRQRYKDQILHDVAHDLIPRVVGTALRERGLNPVAMPDIRDVVIEEGKPMTFVADFETMPAIEVGEYAGLSLRKPAAVLEVGAVDRALETAAGTSRALAPRPKIVAWSLATACSSISRARAAAG
jgi:trigger factor